MSDISTPHIETNEKCMGSTPENEHNLFIVDQKSGNRVCKNDECNFMIKHKDGTGVWKIGFDPLEVKSVVKEISKQ